VAQHNAYWLNPRGKILDIGIGTHIDQVIKSPTSFGLTDRYVRNVYDKHNEPMNLEGKAREELMLELIKDGYVRIRLVTNRFWLVNSNRYDKKLKKALSVWAETAKDVKGAGKYMPVKIVTDKETISDYDVNDLYYEKHMNESDISATKDFHPVIVESVYDFKESKYREFLREKKNKKDIEIAHYPLKDAIEYAQSQFESHGKELYDVIPDFDKHYEFAQTHASSGTHLRKDMPVIHKHDIGKFKQFLEDKGIKSKVGKIAVGTFHPLQKQIYMNKSIDSIAEHGIATTKKFLTDPKVITVISNDHYIIDGHHRMLSGMLVDPKMKFNTLKVDVPATELLPLALEFSDKTGNVRNEQIRSNGHLI